MKALGIALRGVALALVFSFVAPLIAADFPAIGSAAEAATVSRIDVEGNRRVEKETVISYVTIVPGRPYTTADLDESLKALIATGLFSDVRIGRRAAILVVTVVENRLINRVSFEGNKKLKDDQLLTIVESKPRTVLTRAKVQSDLQRILEGYRRSGRYGASVEPKIIELDENRANLVFEIDEGAKTSIARIMFIGNHAYSDAKLRDVIKTSQKNWLSWLKTSDVYDPDRLQSDQELLRRFYLNHGYADFRIISAVADLDRERNVFFVTFTIDEGEKYQFGENEVVTSLREIDPERLRDKARTRTGRTYSTELVEKTLEDITIAAASAGYAFVQVRPSADRDYETRTISITYYVDEGPRVYIERIEIRGNNRTRDYVIRREFDLAEGDAYNRVLIDKAERRLRNLGFFKTVRIIAQQGSAPDRVIVIVEVEEQATGEVSFGVGYSTADGFIAEVTLSEKNFLGRGQFVRIAVGGGENKRTVDFSFTEPYFLGQRISAGVDAYRRVQDNNSTYSYDSETIGGGVRFGFPITDDLTVQVRNHIYQEDITIPASLKNGATADGEASLAIRQAEGVTLVSTVGYSIVYDTRDNIRDPRIGHYVNFSQDIAGVGGDVRYIRTTIEARGYREVMPDWGMVFMLKATAGHITGFGGAQVRIRDSFFKGGETIRGFAPAGIGPRDLTVGSNNDALGGTVFWAVTAELQFPFWGLPPELGLRGAIFADAGSLYDVGNIGMLSPALVGDSSAIRASVGGSIIWVSPFGPLRADFGYAIAKEPYDSTQVFRFSGGTQF